MPTDALIRSIGLFWKAEDVFWGTPKNPGKLLGIPAKALKQSPHDFREQSGIYVLYSEYDLVYVGQTGSGDQKLLKRLNQHRSDDLSSRWDKFSWFGLREILSSNDSLSKETKGAHPSLSTILNHIEAVLIHACEPKLNSQGGRFGSDVIRYLQYRDDRLGKTVNEMVYDLWEQRTQSSK